MDEYINKTEILFEMATSLIPQDYEITRAYAIAKDIIKKAPAADVAPVVHGEWRERSLWIIRYPYECSNCNYVSDLATNYCPNCGARMDGGNSNA